MELIHPPIGEVFYKTNDWGNTEDIINAIIEADESAPLYTEKFALSIPYDNINDICRFLYDYVKTNVRYKEDEDGKQFVQMPGVLVNKKKGDCKSMSLFCASVLKNLGILYKYRFITQDPNSDLHHVYLIVQDENGNNIALDCVENRYNKEVKYYRKKDISTQNKIGNMLNLSQPQVRQVYNQSTPINMSAPTASIQRQAQPPVRSSQNLSQPQGTTVDLQQQNTPSTGFAGLSTETWLLIAAAGLGLYYITKD